jgi:putative membrane-bound dehydrogenase-like protein
MCSLLLLRLFRSLPRGRSGFLVRLAIAVALGSGAPAAERRNYHTAQAPLPPEEAARTMIVPEGFRVTLFAGEPDVLQPIALALDDRGRLWVAEAHQYPNHSTAPGPDRIVILEDTNGDGRHDRRIVFYEGLNYVSGLELGFGGAFVMSPPHFFFIPDRDRDDRPDAAPQLLLDGFGNHANAHNMANNLAWGPDGWLYGTHGRTNWSLPGKPGTPREQRTVFDGGVWRYHPVRHVWEPYMDGTTNPWGIDWNDHGHGFTVTSVEPHLYHVIQGAHHEPWRNRESSRYAYERIPTIADHRHFTGALRVQDGLGTAAEDESGGGHSHAGAMVYLGDNWPERFRNGIFMNNIHGRRINYDILSRAGSGYTGSHGPTLMRSQDPWYMGIALRYGPDGAVYAADWSDTDSCHSRPNTRRETGRIHRITHGQPAWDRVDLATLDDAELVRRQLHRNDWHVRHARRLLQERAAAGRDQAAVHAALKQIFSGNPDVTRKLRALWALHVTGGLTPEFLTAQLRHPDEHIRAWSVKLLCEGREPGAATLERFAHMAAHDESALVRLYLASALQRLEPAQRWGIAAGLVARGEDAADQNLPLMIWYGLQPLVRADVERFVRLVEPARIPLLRRHIARRASEADVRTAGLAAVLSQLGGAAGDELRLDVLTGALAGLQGVRQVPMPAEWASISEPLRAHAHPELSARALELALVFDDPAALYALRRRAADAAAPAAERTRAVETLAGRRPQDLAPLLLELTADPVTRRAAIRALAEYEHPDTPAVLLAGYSDFDADTRQDSIQTLVSRPAWSMRLLDAVEARRVPRDHITAYSARQMQQLGDPALSARLETLWGRLQPSSAETAAEIARWRKALTPAILAKADHRAGRDLYQRLCAACHRLFDDGGSIGPDLTGSHRANLEYILENIIDPNAGVSRDFQLNTITTTSGRVVSGFVAAESESVLTVQSFNERILVPLGEIQERQVSSQSMMPAGLLQGLRPAEVRDLIAYLGREAPLVETAGALQP